jgi:hypothetical protein
VAVRNGENGYILGPRFTAPIVDQRVAKSAIASALQVDPCPPDYVLKSLENSAPTPSVGHHIIIDPTPNAKEYNLQLYNYDRKDYNFTDAAPPPACNFISGGYFCYGKASKSFPENTAYGLWGIFTAERPYLSLVDGGHSLAQIGAVYTTAAAPTVVAGSIELGWTVTEDPIGNTDSTGHVVADLNPHLFSFWSSAGYTVGAYNAQCGL